MAAGVETRTLRWTAGEMGRFRRHGGTTAKLAWAYY